MSENFNFLLGRYGKASADSLESAVNNFLKEYPESPNGLMFLARIQYDRYELEKSLETYRRVYLGDTSNLLAATGMAILFRNLGKLDSAEVYTNIGLRNDITGDAKINRMLLYYAQNDTLKTDSTLQAILRNKKITHRAYQTSLWQAFRLGNDSLGNVLLEELKRKRIGNDSSRQQLKAGTLSPDDFSRRFHL